MKVINSEGAVLYTYLKKRTAYCEGFHNLLQTRGGRFVIDGAGAIAQGLRPALSKALSEKREAVTGLLSSEDMDKDPAEINGQKKGAHFCTQ